MDCIVREMTVQLESRMMGYLRLMYDEEWTNHQIHHRASIGLQYCLADVSAHSDRPVLRQQQSWGFQGWGMHVWIPSQ